MLGNNNPNLSNPWFPCFNAVIVDNVFSLMCHNSEKSGKKVKYLMARKVENFTYLMNVEVIRAQCRCHSNIWMCLFLPATQAIVSGHVKNLPFAQDSANKVSHVLWLARSSESLGPVIANCHYCKRCYGYGYQDGSNHDVSWMDKPEPGARSYVNLMGC